MGNAHGDGTRQTIRDPLIADVEDRLAVDDQLKAEQERVWAKLAALATSTNTDKDKHLEGAKLELDKIKDEIRHNERALDQAVKNFETSRTQRLNSVMEGRKLGYDWLKHLTTLGTGSIVILSSLANNILKEAEWRVVLIPTVVLLFISVVAAFISMWVTYIILSTFAADREKAIRDSTRSRARRGGPVSSESETIYRVLLSGGRLESIQRNTLWIALLSFFLGILFLLIFFIRNIL